MSLGRTSLLTGTFVDSQQHPLANGVLTWQLVVDNPGAAPVVYQVTGDPANGEFVLPISFTTPLDASGTLGAGVAVTAPQDLQLNIAAVLTPTTAYYLITGPDGISFTTTNFAYSASARDIGAVSSNSAPVTYTQAAVTFRVATPQELGISVQVVATLSDQCTLIGFDGVLILPGTEFTTQLDGAGVGTLLLAPNDPVHGGITVPVDPSRTSANVVWWISVNGAPSFPIQVPAAGGYIDDLIVGIDGQGNVVPVTLLTKLTITANLTLTAATDIVFANAASGNIVITLPDATSTVKRFTIYKTDSSAHTVTLQTVSGQTLNGAATLVIGTQYQAATPVSDTANWVSALSSSGGGGFANPMTAQGSLIAGAPAGVPAELKIGTAGQTLGPVGLDVDWITPSGIPGGAGAADVTLTEGDIAYRKKVSRSSLVIGYIGDSITITNPGSGAPPSVTDTDLSTDGLSVSGANQGVSGTASSDWLPGSTNLTSAKTAFVAAGVRMVHIMLGTNDARVAVRNSAATFQTNLQSIVSDLVGSGFLVAISYPPYAVPGSNSGDQDATANTLRIAYQAKINQIVNGRDVFLADTSAFAYFAANPGQLSDGIHPTVAGVAALAQLWANGLTPLVSALTQQVTRQPLPIGANGQVLTVAAGYPAWQNAAGGLTNPMTTSGDLILGGTAGAAGRLAKGADAQVLTVDPITHLPLWANSAAGFANPMTTPGDLISGGAAGAAGRLGVGSAGQSLQVVAGAPGWATQPVYAPVVTGATPGPTAIADTQGRFIMCRVA